MLERELFLDEADATRISIRMRGEDIQFLASNFNISIYVTDEEMEKIVSQGNALLQDRKKIKESP